MAAKNGDTVRIHYTGTLTDGTVFDSSQGREPLEAVLGQEMLIPGFEEAVVGMEAGDRKTVVVPPNKAYGVRLEEFLLPVPKEKFPADMPPEEGMVYQLSTEDGDLEARVLSMTESEVILDANHPLAGEALTFDIELVSIG